MSWEQQKAWHERTTKMVKLYRNSKIRWFKSLKETKLKQLATATKDEKIDIEKSLAEIEQKLDKLFSNVSLMTHQGQVNAS